MLDAVMPKPAMATMLEMKWQILEVQAALVASETLET